MTESKDDMLLECQHVSHEFHGKKVLHDINFKMKRGSFVALIGPSGCGKSTLLRAILGTHPPSAGKIVICSGAPSYACFEVKEPGRHRGIVYQRYSLFPFMTALQNVAVGLTFDQTQLPQRAFNYRWFRDTRKRHMEEAAELLVKLRLKDAMHLYPHEMSGGMCQRVAIAQALIIKPEILLLDEAFGALDAGTREELQRMMITLHEESIAAREKGEKPPYSFLLVTHEIAEALFVAERIIGLSQRWDWDIAGYKECPGSTIVYDKPCHIYKSTDEPTFADMKDQREAIRKAVYHLDLHENAPLTPSTRMKAAAKPAMGA